MNKTSRLRLIENDIITSLLHKGYRLQNLSPKVIFNNNDKLLKSKKLK